MSVINQVLNQLEQRGEHAATEQPLVRAVPQRRRTFLLPLLAIALALVSGLAAWQWIQARKPVLSSVEGPVLSSVEGPKPAELGAMPYPATAPAPQSAVSEVSAAGTAAPVSETPLAGAPAPASRLSFELNSVPLPSSLRGPRGIAEPGRTEAAPASASPPAQPARPQPAVPPGRVARAASDISPMKQVSPAQRADAEFRKAVAAMQQGHVADAIAGYEAALRLDAAHDAARQALAALLLEGKRGAEAMRVLQDGLRNRPEQTGFAMLLARLQVEQGSIEQAAATLERSLPYADVQADFQAFFAALLQRGNRHKEAVTHYQIALQLAPGNGIWLMGYGISLQAVQRTDDARDAFRRSLESGTLNPELQAFVQQKLKGL